MARNLPRNLGVHRMRRVSGIPSYRRHSSGQAVVTLPDISGRRRDFLLGSFGTDESRREYTRVINEWQENNHRFPGQAPSDLTVVEMILAFWHHVERHYRHPDGTPTSEVDNFRLSLKPLKELYGHAPAAKFGPLALKAIRRSMIDAKLARGVINQRIGRIRRAFKWAVSEEMIPASVIHALNSVDGLQAGRTEAKERPRVLPVDDERVEAVLPVVNRHVRAMIQLQRLTGMRPGEVCSMKRSEIDMSGTIWLYRPTRHKTSWRKKERTIPLGPKAQEIIKTFFTPNIDDYLFSPMQAREERFAKMRALRKTKIQPSQICRRKNKPQRQPREKFTPISYANAIHRACIKVGIPKWHPNQLRHAFATEIRRRFGLEAAQVGLGHSRADVTQVYAEANAALATKVAAEVG
jgi:integrase